jgi:putative endonuclease
MGAALAPSLLPMSATRHVQLGAVGEQVAEAHLMKRGYAIADRNFRTRYGELDIVALDGDCLVFCEVKTRLARPPPGPFGPLTGVGSRKRRQVRRMARQWLAERAGSSPRRPELLRFDAIGVTFGHGGELLHIEHLEDAF